MEREKDSGVGMSSSRARRDLLGLFLLSLVVRLATAALIRRPGYMDAAYYAAGAVRLAEGGGLTEPFLWHYLDDPAGHPHPGFLYWMPLPSLLAAPFAVCFPGSFLALQLPFALLSALLPLVGYAVAWQASAVRRHAWVAGLLTLFSGFFFPYWTLPETFAPFALWGSAAFWLAGKPVARHRWRVGGRWWLIGALVGLAHLTRADGVLLLPVVLLAPLVRHRPRNGRHGLRVSLRRSAWAVLGYLMVMGPWFLRNLGAVGAPLAPGGTKTLWLTNYDDLFCYGCDLSPQAYLAWGWPEILRSKLWAAGVNLERFLAEDCLVFLLPFVLVGLYRLRRCPPFTLSLIYLLIIYAAHSLAFTFPGPRGGFFHASAAALPFLLAAGAEALEALVGWTSRRRGWKRRQAQTVFAAAAVVAAVALSAYAAGGKLPAWRDADAVYVEIGAWLDARDVAGKSTVMVANAPAFWYHTRRPAVAVPNGGLDVLLEVAERYQVAYLVLDRNRPAPLAALYAGEEDDVRLNVVATWEEGGGRVVLYTVD